MKEEHETELYETAVKWLKPLVLINRDLATKKLKPWPGCWCGVMAIVLLEAKSCTGRERTVPDRPETTKVGYGGGFSPKPRAAWCGAG